MALTDANTRRVPGPFTHHDGDEPMTIGAEGACAEPAASTARTRVG